MCHRSRFTATTRAVSHFAHCETLQYRQIKNFNGFLIQHVPLMICRMQILRRFICATQGEVTQRLAPSDPSTPQAFQMLRQAYEKLPPRLETSFPY